MTSPDITLPIFAQLVANLFRKEKDDHRISLGDWSPPDSDDRPPRFYATIQVTVGDFRRWAREAGLDVTTEQ